MRWAAVACLAGTYAAALAALAPATLVDARLDAATHGRLRLAEARGSLWRGEGWLEIRDAAGEAGIARRLAWRVQPERLLGGRLVAQVRFDRAATPFPISLSFSRVEVSDAVVQIPAAALALGMARLSPLRLSGEVSVRIARLAFENGRAEGSATLEWRAAGSALTPVAPLGDYQLRLDADAAGLHASLATLAGPLQLEGRGAWSGGAAPSFFGLAHIGVEEREQLAPLFRLIAVERGAGVFELSANRGGVYGGAQ